MARRKRASMREGPLADLFRSTDESVAPRMLMRPDSALGEASHFVSGSCAVAVAGVKPTSDPLVAYQVWATSTASVRVTSALVSVALSIATRFGSFAGGLFLVRKTYGTHTQIDTATNTKAQPPRVSSPR